MATLSQTTQATRKILKWAGIAAASFLLIRLIIFPIGSALFNSLFPTEPPAPTVTFGKLPNIPFPSGQKPNNLRFTIETTTGALPTNIPDRITVYTFTKKQAGFASYERAREKVLAAGFAGEGTALSQIVYQWSDPKIEGRQIVFNTVTNQFTLTTKFASSSAEHQTPPPAPSTAIIHAREFISGMSLMPKDLDDQKTKTTLLRTRNGSLTRATSLSESDFVQVDFYRKNFHNTPIVHPHANSALISFLIQSDDERLKRLAKISYSYKEIDEKTSSTYPIKTAQHAFAQLQQGNAYLALYTPGKTTIGIQNVYVAYYEGADDIVFLLPVFVFEGEGFVAYVQAVTDEWSQ